MPHPRLKENGNNGNESRSINFRLYSTLSCHVLMSVPRFPSEKRPLLIWTGWTDTPPKNPRLDHELDPQATAR